jgi:hypothetical protein
MALLSSSRKRRHQSQKALHIRSRLSWQTPFLQSAIIRVDPLLGFVVDFVWLN